MSDATPVRLLVFRVGNLVCAADVTRVREILPRLETTRIPGAPPVVAGLVNVRGSLVTVVEAWRALGQPSPDGQGSGGTTVVLEVGGDRRLIGLLVDEVTDLFTTSGDALEGRAGLAGIDPVLVRAVGRRGDQLFVVLDTEALLAPILAS